jgi:ABC-type nitrate/sulfonate/bicarbonate transport system substrate-binding protein
LKKDGLPLSPEVLKESFARVEFTTDPLQATIDTMAQWTVDIGLIPNKPDLKDLVDLSLLKKAQAK